MFGLLRKEPVQQDNKQVNLDNLKAMRDQYIRVAEQAARSYVDALPAGPEKVAAQVVVLNLTSVRKVR